MKRHRRLRFKPILVALGLAVAAVSTTYIWKPEPLTRDQILQKDDWTPDELVDTMSRVTGQYRKRESRREIFRHLRKQLRKLPEKKRREVMQQSLDRSVAIAYQQWQTMPDEAKEKMVAAMEKEAKKNRETVEGLSKDRKEEIRERLESPEGKEWMNRMRQHAVSRMTPEDRRILAPVVREWIKTLESL